MVASNEVTHPSGPNNPFTGTAPGNVKLALDNADLIMFLFNVRATGIESAVAALESIDAGTRLGALELANAGQDSSLVDLTTRASNLEAADTAFDTRVAALEASVAALQTLVASLLTAAPVVSAVQWDESTLKYPSRPNATIVLYVGGPGPNGVNHVGTAPTSADLHVDKVPA